jgi:hypothetical protein
MISQVNHNVASVDRSAGDIGAVRDGVGDVGDVVVRKASGP